MMYILYCWHVLTTQLFICMQTPPPTQAEQLKPKEKPTKTQDIIPDQGKEVEGAPVIQGEGKGKNSAYGGGACMCASCIMT